MKAPSKRKVEQGSLRDKILVAAKIEFGDKGYEGARMDEIAKAAGASKQVIYHHYQSKENLFEEVLRSSYQDFRGRDDALRERIGGMNATDALHEFVAFLFKPSVETFRFQQMAQDENRFQARHAIKFVEARERYDNLIATLSGILAKGAEEGVFRRDVEAVNLYMTITGAFMFRITNAYTLTAMLGVALDTEAGHAQERDRTMRILLDALRP